MRSGHSIKGVEVEVQEALPKPAEEKAAKTVSVSVCGQEKVVEVEKPIVKPQVKPQAPAGSVAHLFSSL